MKPTIINVVLKVKKSSLEKSFTINQANKLLKLSNSAWELSDPKFVWNGKEIAKAKKKKTD